MASYVYASGNYDFTLLDLVVAFNSYNRSLIVPNILSIVNLEYIPSHTLKFLKIGQPQLINKVRSKIEECYKEVNEYDK